MPLLNEAQGDHAQYADEQQEDNKEKKGQGRKEGPTANITKRSRSARASYLGKKRCHRAPAHLWCIFDKDSVVEFRRRLLDVIDE